MSFRLVRLVSFVCLLASACNNDPVPDAGSCEDCGGGVSGSMTGGGTAGGAGGGGGGAEAGGQAGGQGPRDGGSSPDAGRTLRSLRDYRRCTSDGDCPVGLGVCLFEVPLNRPDRTGRRSLAITDIFPGLGAGEGVCSLACTTTSDTCQGLTLQGTSPDPRPHVCQVVATGASPYPDPRPAFPFDSQLDPSELAQGVPFAALCRPPFELSPQVPDDFCAACTGPSDCSGLCFDTLRAAAVDGGPGLCLSSCTAPTDCPLGFSCAALAGGSFCRPALDTCSTCSDRDRDGRGAGRCGMPAAPVTPHDCDDREPRAFADPSRPTHPFPAWCGAHDFNCNGLSDDAEQIGSTAFGAQHCTACADSCQGALANAVARCQQVVVDGGSAPRCQPFCNQSDAGLPLFANCDDQLSTGCEVAVNDPTRVYFRDLDGDRRGDPLNQLFACVPGVPPTGYVQNAADCDDSQPTVFGPSDAGVASPETCDGRDNDCNGRVDDAVPGTNTSCVVPGALGVCQPGRTVCQGSLPLRCVSNVMATAEACGDNLDNDCNGQVDEATAVDAGRWFLDQDLDGFGTSTDAGTSQGVPTSLVACRAPTTGPRYVFNNLDCNDQLAAIKPDAGEVCDGTDNNCNTLVDDADPTVINRPTWFLDTDGDGFGAGDGGFVNGRLSIVAACVMPAGYASMSGDCNNANAQVNPAALEVCSDAVDNNCNGQTNELVAGNPGVTTWYTDADGDGFGLTSSLRLACGATPPAGTVAQQGDCNDAASTAFPGAPERCDGIDNDCSAVTSVDRGCPTGAWPFPSGPTQEADFHGFTNHTPATDSCPSNMVLVGFNFFSGGWVDAWQGFCSDVSMFRDPGGPPFTYTFLSPNSIVEWNNLAAVGRAAALPRRGSPNTGWLSTFFCPSGQVVTGLSLGWNNWIDFTRVRCGRLTLSPAGLIGVAQSPATVVTQMGTTSGQYGGNGFTTQADSTCTSLSGGLGMAATGYRIHSNNGLSGSVHGAAVQCRALSLPVIP